MIFVKEYSERTLLKHRAPMHIVVTLAGATDDHVKGIFQCVDEA